MKTPSILQKFDINEIIVLDKTEFKKEMLQ